MIPEWMGYALLGLVALSLFAVSAKRILDTDDGVDAILLAAMIFLLVGLGAGALWCLTSPVAADLELLTTDRVWPLAVADVVVYAIGPGLYYRALQRLPLGQATIIYTFVGVFTLLLGVALGLEALDDGRAIGALLVVISVWLVSRRAGERAQRGGVVTMVAATAVYALGILIDRELVAVVGLSSHGALTLAFLPSGLLLLGWCAWRRGPGRERLFGPLRRPMVYVPAAAQLIAYASVFHAYSLGGPASGVAVVLATETIVVVVLSALLLGERDHLAVKGLAAALAVAGVRLIG